MPNDPLIEAIARALKAHRTDSYIRSMEDEIAGKEEPYDGFTDEEFAQAALDAISAAGYAVVPREPTPKMIDATWNDPIDQLGAIESQNTRNVRIYKAMLSAAALAGRP